jgi:dTDP-4-amino-4,6-dideoxygalactose transaminase
MIPFNKPYFTGREAVYIEDAVKSGHISGNGKYTKKCQEFFENSYGFQKCLLTSSCTDALEMAAILIDIQPGDEVIVPSFTFVSTANAFALRGAKIVFVDSRSEHPGMNEDMLEQLITPRTKAIVPVHYAGVACDMDKIMALAEKYDLFVIEDAAQAIHSFYVGHDGRKRALGSIGHFAAFSFHETKNIISGEGGMLVINDERLNERAEIIWEKGTNRSKFFRGEVDKYSWVDVGSSFLPSDVIAAFLWAQLENLQKIQTRRNEIWRNYIEGLTEWVYKKEIQLPAIPDFATNNAHMLYLIMPTGEDRNQLIQYLKEKGINAVFHYQSLHQSTYAKEKGWIGHAPQSDRYSECLVRLPFFYDLGEELVINTCRNYD